MGDDKEYWSRQTVLVTGSSRGIGRSIALGLAKKGAKIAVHCRSNLAAAEETARLCGGDARFYQAAVGNEDDVASMLAAIERELGPVSILVNNAGETDDALLAQMTLAQWQRVVDTCLTGAFLCSRGVLRNMIKAKFGRIVNVSSVSGVRGNPGQCNYAAAKAGLIGFTKALAKEVGSKNITCNAVALGPVDTEMLQRLGPEQVEARRLRTAVKRLGTPEEAAAIVAYLAGPDSSFLTGEVITMDGGLA